MFNPMHLLANMDLGYTGPDDLAKHDLNGDGVITAQDCPFSPGTLEAKMWVKQVLEPYVQQQITPEMKAQYGDKVVGAYHGKPLVPGGEGSPSEPQGDFTYLVDKLMLTQGLSKVSAAKVAGKIRFMKYGG